MLPKGSMKAWWRPGADPGVQLRSWTFQGWASWRSFSDWQSFNANKVKYEKDNHLCEARLDLEDAVKGKAELHKQGKLVQAASNTRLDEMARALNEAESTKKHLQVENQDLNGQIEELENDIANMNKTKIFFRTQLEYTKAIADAEAKGRGSLLTKCKMRPREPER